jgi:A-factor type gamma-butyrolactone 1'-reductase (1S-forming)
MFQVTHLPRSAPMLDGKTCIITGAAGGIGRVTAFTFAREGARLMLTDIDGDRGQALADELAQLGVEVDFTAADTRDAASCDAFVAQAISRFGRIDVAFNNAGHIGVLGLMHDYDRTELQRIVDINIYGTWNCMQAEIKAMLTTGGGVICNNASAAGLVGGPGFPPYIMAKHAIVGLTRAAAMDYAPHNIRINAVAPGTIDTDMPQRLTGGDPTVLGMLKDGTPLKRFGRPEEVAEAVTFLCSERASFNTGSINVIDGGWTAQ